MDPRSLNVSRSKDWVAALANELLANESEKGEVVLFTRSNTSNRIDFGLNELLYDICLVRTERVRAAVHDVELVSITEALWQVESEFAKNSRSALVDFNKLVIGSAKNKLFVGSLIAGKRGRAYRDVLAVPAAYVAGNCYLAMIPHPSSWDTAESNTIRLWCYSYEQKGWDESVL